MILRLVLHTSSNQTLSSLVAKLQITLPLQDQHPCRIMIPLYLQSLMCSAIVLYYEHMREP